MTPQGWIGVDIGGTKTAVMLSAEPPIVDRRIEFPTRPEEGPEHALEAIRRSIAELAGGSPPQAIGVSCGGPLDREAGVIQAPPNLATWIDVHITGLLGNEFGCPCRLENDANAGAVAEHRFGAGAGARNLIFLTMGTGLGAGIIIEGRLYHGSSDLAGEIGHVRLTPSGPMGYNKAGSVEGWASGGGIAHLAAAEAAKARTRGTATLLAALENPTARDVADAARQGDRVARRVIRKAGEKLGVTLAILVDILNPDRIVIGGLAMRLGAAILDPARRVLQREALAPSVAACEIVPAALGESIGDVAALSVAMGLT